RISRALRELENREENQVVHLREKFTANTTDEDWLRQLGADGDWVVVTCDTSISKNPHEIKAWLESGLIVFFLKSGWLNLAYWEFAWQLIKRWPLMKNKLGRASRGKGYIVPIRSAAIEEL
ncbi:MAG: hypothetical protein IMZ50_01090, partial [Candidatus Atribacteria bacterium]|nr:hypothetical protein [Candidatus Atribacteria bacterium]